MHFTINTHPDTIGLAAEDCLDLTAAIDAKLGGFLRKYYPDATYTVDHTQPALASITHDGEIDGDQIVQDLDELYNRTLNSL